MAFIKSIRAREVLDSRGNPTVEADVCATGGFRGRAIAPSGASTGAFEAIELRDGDMNRHGGKGVLRAVENVHARIAPALLGRDVADQSGIDASLCEIDGSSNFSAIGANAALAVSLAAAHCSAHACGLPLYRALETSNSSIPLPMVNMISGGMHAGRQLDFQDFLIMPVGADSFRQAIEWVVRVHRALGGVLDEQGFETVLVADEGGYGPKLRRNRDAVECILQAIERANLAPGDDVALAVDVASSHFYRDGRYWLTLDQDEKVDLDDDGMIELLSEWSAAFPIVSIEDGLAEDDWDGWKKLTRALGSRVRLVGDDLLVTQTARLERAIAADCANAVLVKPNQVGTLTQAQAVIGRAKAAGYATIVSARSGETEDVTIADLAVGAGAGQIKIGCITRGERLCKYNQLLRIEEESGLPFAGRTAVRASGSS